MAVAFVNFFLAIALTQLGALGGNAGVLAQAHGAALRDVPLLVRHQSNNIVLAVRRKLAGVGIGIAQHIAGIFHNHNLHTQADAKIRDVLFPCIAGGLDHALNAAVAKAAGQDDAIHTGKLFSAALLIQQVFAVHPVDLHFGLILKAGVIQGLHYTQVCVMQLDIFANQGNGAGLAAGGNAGDQLFPLGQVAGRSFQVQLTANNVGQAGSFQHQRALVQAGHGQVFNHAIRAHIAEHADLALDIAANAAIGTQHDDVGGDAHALQFLAGMLGGLGFIFVRAGNIGHQNHMDVAAVFHALLNANLADGLQERLALNITGGTADFSDDNIGFGAFGKIVDIALDRILKNNVVTNRENNTSNALLLEILSYALPFLFLLFIMNFNMKRMGGGGIMGVGKSNAKMYVQKETGITF